MDITQAFKSIVDLDEEAIVIVNLSHEIVYLNPAAIKKYANRGGAALLGNSLLACHNEKSGEIIKETVGWMLNSMENNKKYMYFHQECDTYMAAIREEDGTLIGYYEKFERRR